MKPLAMEPSLMEILKQKWKDRFNSAPPKSAKMMELVLGWYEGTGGQDSIMRITRILDKLEELSSDNSSNKRERRERGNKLNPNTKLIKIWRGKRYEVFASDDGFIYEGEIYRSLTKVAEIITGRHQSGNVFFGLKK